MTGRLSSSRAVGSHGTRRGARRLAPTIVMVLLAVTLAGPPLRLAGEAWAAPSRGGAVFHHGDDWRHLWQVVAALKAKPPKVPVVYLLGGSAARECTINDKSWTAEVRHLGGPRVRLYDLGTSSQSYAKDITVVNDLPAVPSIVLIGVNLGRYTFKPSGTGSTGAAQQAGDLTPGRDAGASLSTYFQHRFSVSHILTDAEKKVMVGAWLKERYPVFKARYAYNVGELDQLIATCQTRDLHPVLLELPLNLKIVGHAFDKPRTRYRDSCRRLARKHGIPKIDFLAKAGLVSGDFADLCHLVEPGRVKWQLKLSKTVISLLDRYGMGRD